MMILSALQGLLLFAVVCVLSATAIVAALLGMARLETATAPVDQRRPPASTNN